MFPRKYHWTTPTTLRLFVWHLFIRLLFLMGILLPSFLLFQSEFLILHSDGRSDRQPGLNIQFVEILHDAFKECPWMCSRRRDSSDVLLEEKWIAFSHASISEVLALIHLTNSQILRSISARSHSPASSSKPIFYFFFFFQTLVDHPRLAVSSGRKQPHSHLREQ